MSVADNLKQIGADLKDGVCLVAVSKFHSAELIKEAYESGQRDFGESKVQEMSQKYEVLPKDIRWHFIGHLQTNKVKYIVPYVSLIHGVDSEKLMREIDKQAKKVCTKVRCLLQIHIAKEDTKFGFSPSEAMALLREGKHKELGAVEICGLMAMASNTDDEEMIRAEFRAVKNLFEEMRREFFSDDQQFSILSIGMSDDYHIAMEEGGNMIRVGSKIFGNRIY